MKATNPAARKSPLNKTARYWFAGFVCLALLLFGSHFTPKNRQQSVLEPVQANAQNRTGFDIDAFRDQYDKDGDGEVDAPDETADEPNVADEPDDSDDGSDDGDDKDDLEFESDGEEDSPDHASFDDDRDGDGDGKYDLDEGEAPDRAGISRTGRTARSRPAELSRLGLLNELTPVPHK